MLTRNRKTAALPLGLAGMLALGFALGARTEAAEVCYTQDNLAEAMASNSDPEHPSVIMSQADYPAFIVQINETGQWWLWENRGDFGCLIGAGDTYTQSTNLKPEEGQ